MIYTKRLRLEVLTMNDLDIFFEINKNPRNNIFKPEGPMKSKEQAVKALSEVINHWEVHKCGSWKIYNEKNIIIGFGGLGYRSYGDDIKLNLGYRIDEQYWGNGYATEFAIAAIKFAVEILKEDDIYGLVRPNHIASIKVLEKCGMTKIGELDDVPGQSKSIIYKY